MTYRLICGDAIAAMRELPPNSVHCAITSPPYYGLRDYGTATWEGGDAACDHVANPAKTKTFGNPDFNGTRPSREATKIDGYYFKDTCGKCGARRIDQQIGLEATPDEYVARLVEVFREVRRVLHPSGVLFLNIGDSYNSGAHWSGGSDAAQCGNTKRVANGKTQPLIDGLKNKDLIGIPWMVAFALRADGWWLRSEIIWHKRAPMPESVTDRPTKAHEQVFLLAKNASYFYDHIAIAEQGNIEGSHSRGNGFGKLSVSPYGRQNVGTLETPSAGRNKRSVWTLGPESYSGAHYATMPTKLVEPMVLAGTSAHGCCSKCGSPWERVVEKDAQLEQGRKTPGYGTSTDAGDFTTNGHGKSTLHHTATSTTTGWAATCSCNSDVIPCTVLDCFFGSGTTAAVALKHGRDFIGIDLDARNLDLARKRIEESQPMLIGDIT